jgi:hypothetical protein
MTLMMLLVFVSQVTAATVISCKMLSQEHSADMEQSMDMNMTGMDHSMHQMNDDSSASGSIILDCCEAGANCSMGSCLSMLSIATSSLNKPQITVQKVLQATLALVSQTPSSLYRPPILS